MSYITRWVEELQASNEAEKARRQFGWLPDDSAFIVAPEAMTVYRSPQAYMSVNVVSNLQVQIAIYGFMATIVKMPNGLVRYNLA